MKHVQLNDLEFSLPGNWNELSTGQLLVLANMLLRDNMTVEEIKIKMLFTAMEAHVTNHTREGRYTLVFRKSKLNLSAADVLAMASVFDFLFEENANGVMVLRSKLTKNPFPILPCKCSTRLVGPEEGLADLTYEQAIEAESFLQKFSKSKNPSDYHRFVSALHRTGGHFDIDKLEANAKLVAHASPAQLHLVYLFWCGCMERMAHLYPNCFSGAKESETSPKKPFELHRDIIYKLSGGDITKETTIEKLELHRVYHVLNTKIEEDEKARAEYERLKQKHKR